jgi:gamma-glutamyltranspeptidase/glutathione hydrolase
MASKGAAGASVPCVARAARDALSRGNAVDAVVAGVLVAAAESPSVLLGPLQMLVAGAGAGLRAVDGRARQPGQGAPRPRGLLSGESAPPTALVGVPVLPAAMASVLASLGSASWRRVAGGAIERARAHSVERARILEALARRGAAALGEEGFVSELVAAAGRSERGLLTRADLASARPELVACDDRDLGQGGWLTVPWKGESFPDASFTEVVAAADARGLVAIACYNDPPQGLPIPALGLVAPAMAAPVKRGEPRVRPGEPLPAAAPTALHVVRGIADLAVGLARAAEAEAVLSEILRIDPDSTGAVVTGVEAAAGRAVALARVRSGARVVCTA